MNSRLQNCCPHTLAECLWEELYVQSSAFYHSDIRACHSPTTPDNSCACVRMCDHRLHIVLVLMQHSLTCCSECVCAVSLSLYRSVTFTSIIYANIKMWKKVNGKNSKHVCSLLYILTYLHSTFPHSLGWVPQALGQSSCNTQGWKSWERVSRVTLSSH